MRNEKLIQYILEQLEIQDINQAELARRSKLSKPTISKLLSGQTPHPTNTTLQGIARGLKKPDPVIFSLVSNNPTPTIDPNLEEINLILSNLPPSYREDIIEYARHRARMAEQRGEYATQGNLGETP